MTSRQTSLSLVSPKLPSTGYETHVLRLSHPFTFFFQHTHYFSGFTLSPGIFFCNPPASFRLSGRSLTCLSGTVSSKLLLRLPYLLGSFLELVGLVGTRRTRWNRLDPSRTLRNFSKLPMTRHRRQDSSKIVWNLSFLGNIWKQWNNLVSPVLVARVWNKQTTNLAFLLIPRVSSLSQLDAIPSDLSTWSSLFLRTRSSQSADLSSIG